MLLRKSRLISVNAVVFGNVRLILIALLPPAVMTPKLLNCVLVLDSIVFILICRGILPAALPTTVT